MFCKCTYLSIILILYLSLNTFGWTLVNRWKHNPYYFRFVKGFTFLFVFFFSYIIKNISEHCVFVCRAQPWCRTSPLCCLTRQSGKLQTTSTPNTSLMLMENSWGRKRFCPSLQVTDTFDDLCSVEQKSCIGMLIPTAVLPRKACLSGRGPCQDGALLVFRHFISEVSFFGGSRSGAAYRRNNWCH